MGGRTSWKEAFFGSRSRKIIANPFRFCGIVLVELFYGLERRMWMCVQLPGSFFSCNGMMPTPHKFMLGIYIIELLCV